MLPRYLTWCGACACVNDLRIRNEIGVAFPPYNTKYKFVRILTKIDFILTTGE